MVENKNSSQRKKEFEKLEKELIDEIFGNKPTPKPKPKPKPTPKPDIDEFKKKCGRCKRRKLKINFNEDKRFSDGLRSICILCEKEIEKEKISAPKPKPTPKPKPKPKPKPVSKPTTEPTKEKIETTNEDDPGLIYSVIAVGIIVGVIYLTFRIIGAGIDYLFPEDENENYISSNSTTTQITTFRPTTTVPTTSSSVIIEETTNSYVMRGINIFKNKELMKNYKEEWPLLTSIKQVVGNGEEVEIFVEGVGIKKFSYILYNGCEYVFEQEEFSYILNEVFILKPNIKCKTQEFGRSLNNYEDAKIVLFGNNVSVEYNFESKLVLISTGQIFNGLNSTYYGLHAAISNAVIFAKRSSATTTTTTVPPTTTTTVPPTTTTTVPPTTTTTVPPTTTTTLPVNYQEKEDFQSWSGTASYPYNFEVNSMLTFYEICTDDEFTCRDYRIDTNYDSSNKLSGKALNLNIYRTLNRTYGFQLPTDRNATILKMRIASTWRDLYNAKVEVFFQDSTSEVINVESINYSYASNAQNYWDFSYKFSKNIEKFEITSNMPLYLDDITWGYNNDQEPPTWPNYPYTEIKVANITRYYFEVLWPAANDNVNVAGYYFYLNGTKVAEYKRINDNNSIFLDGLTRNTTYELEVIAYDDAGNLSVKNPTIIVTTRP